MKPTIEADAHQTNTLLATVVADPAAQVIRPGDSLPIVPGYELIGLLGRGGMGVVYRARDLNLQREVAVKILQSAAAPSAVGRFFEEARITGQLQHPGIPAIHQIGTLDDKRPCLAMKLIKGDTLDTLLKAGQVNYLPIFEAICQAVGYAHAHGVIHRDLKPSNIMVGAFGEVQVMDWGLAKVLFESKPERTGPNEPITTEIHSLRDRNVTQGGSVMGTPAYMAPEQAAGEIGKVDRRADVFGLGGILCAMLTGRPPFAAAIDESVRLNALRGNTKAAQDALDGCGADPELVSLCKRCLAFEPNERPADASAVAQEVAALRAAADQRAKQAELERERSEVQAAEQRKRRKVQMALAASLLLLVVGGGAAALWQERQRSNEARLVGERDAEKRFKVEQARQGVRANLALATDLRKQYKFKATDAALVQAEELAKSGAPEMWAEIEQARSDLAFVVQLDDIRFRKWVWIAEEGGKGHFNTKIASPEYRKAFADRGLDLEMLDPVETARRIAASAVKADLVAAVDDWALYERDESLRNRLLAIAGRADPGEWLNRLRDPAVWDHLMPQTKLADLANIPHRIATAVRDDLMPLTKLAVDADPGATSISALYVLATLMERKGLNPTSLLLAARNHYPTDFELAFALGHWHAGSSKNEQNIGPYEAARALRPENLAVWNNLGIAFAEKGDLEDAIAAFKGAIHRDPRFAIAHCNLGGSLKQKGDLSGAIAAFKEAINLDPNYSIAYNGLGGAFAEKGDLDDAIAAFKEAINRDPKLAKSYRNLGALLKKKGDLSGAIAAFKEAINLDPNYAEAYNNLGVSLKQEGDLSSAIVAFKEAIRLDPKFADGYCSLGAALAQKGDLSGAIAAAKEAINLDPNHAKAHSNLGFAFAQKGDLSGAIAAFKEAIKHDLKLSIAHYGLGTVLERKGDEKGAIAAWKEAIKHDPKHVGTHAILGVVLLRKGDMEGAIAAFKEAIKHDPKHAEAYSNLGAALYRKGDVEGAIAAWKEAIKHDPKRALAHSNLGTALYYRKGDVDGAIAAWKEAIKHDPKDAEAHYNLAIALNVKGDEEGAIAALKEAVKHNPKDAKAHYSLGVMYLRQKNYPEAIACARAATKADPTYSMAFGMLGDLLARTGEISAARSALTEAARLDPKRWASLLAKLPAGELLPPPREVKGP